MVVIVVTWPQAHVSWISNLERVMGTGSRSYGCGARAGRTLSVPPSLTPTPPLGFHPVMFRRALEWFGGSVLVYALVAACAGADLDGKGDAPSGGADGDGGGKSGMGASGSGGTGSGNSPGSTGGTSIMNPVDEVLAFVESGTRLKVRTIEGADGSANVIAGQFYDSELEETCYPGRAADGVTRCLPMGGATAFFSDPSCSDRIAYAAKGCTVQKFFRWTTTGAVCGTSDAHLSKVGGLVSPTELYSGTPETCTAVTPAALDIYLEIYDFYEVGPELPASTFVEITDGTL